MEKIQCKACGNEITGTSNHYCSASQKEEDHSGDFLASMVIGMVTDNALLGGIIGGDFAGGMVGDMLAGDDGNSGGFGDIF